MLFCANFWLQIHRHKYLNNRVKMASSPPESWPSYFGKQLLLVLAVVLTVTVMMQSTVVCMQKYNVKRVLWGQREEMFQTKTSAKNSNLSIRVAFLSPRLEYSLISWDNFCLWDGTCFWLNPKNTRTEILTFVIRALLRGCVEAERVNASAPKQFNK